MEDDGHIPARGFITRLYSATVSTVSKYGKKKYVNRAKLTAQSVYTFYVNLIHQQNMNMNFSQSILYTTMQEILLFLVPKDNKDFSHCSLIKNFPPISPHPLFGQQYNVHSSALKKAETTRNAFVQVFFKLLFT